jgi:hypothetical protein
MMMEKAGEDQLDQSCEKWSSTAQSQGGQKYPTYNTKKEGKLDWWHLVQELSTKTH